MTDYKDLELYEERMEWQEKDEAVNADIIFEHELKTIEPKDLGNWFRSELKRRQIGG